MKDNAITQHHILTRQSSQTNGTVLIFENKPKLYESIKTIMSIHTAIISLCKRA